MEGTERRRFSPRPHDRGARGRGTFDFYIIAMLPNMELLSKGGVRRSLLHGVLIND